MAFAYTSKFAWGTINGPGPLILFTVPPTARWVIRTITTSSDTADAFVTFNVSTGGVETPLWISKPTQYLTAQLDTRQALNSGDQLVLRSTAAYTTWLITGYDLNV